MPVKILRLRRPDTCVVCSAGLEIGLQASWDSSAKSVTCMACAGPAPKTVAVEPIDAGRAGRSATREYERRSTREWKRKAAVVEQDAQWRAATTAKHPLLGRVVTAMTPRPEIGPESQATAAWKQGAAGEVRVAEILDACAGVRILHDRRIPGSKANIDHLAVGSSGVFVIDAKKHEDRSVEQRDRGSWLRHDFRLYVDERDRSKLVEGVEWQIREVEDVLVTAGLSVPVVGCLCFVGARWPVFFRRPLQFGAVTALWPDALADLVTATGPLDAEEIDRVANGLATKLRPA